MNKEMIEFVADVIEAENRFNLQWFCYKKSENGNAATADLSADDVVHGGCSTTACIAGWVNALDGHYSLADESHAAELLGLSLMQGYNLFYGHDGWDIEDPMVNATAADAARVLRSIASGNTVLVDDYVRA